MTTYDSDTEAQPVEQDVIREVRSTVYDSATDTTTLTLTRVLRGPLRD